MNDPSNINPNHVIANMAHRGWISEQTAYAFIHAGNSQLELQAKIRCLSFILQHVAEQFDKIQALSN